MNESLRSHSEDVPKEVPEWQQSIMAYRYLTRVLQYEAFAYQNQTICLPTAYNWSCLAEGRQDTFSSPDHPKDILECTHAKEEIYPRYRG